MKLLVKGAIAAAIALSFGATADCNVDRWDVKNASAKSVIDGAVRYEGLCALDGSTGSVEKNVNGNGDTYFRFFVFAKNDESNLTVFQATDGKNKADVKLNGGNIELGTAKVALSKGKWHNVEIHLKGTEAKIKVDGANEKTATVSGLGNITKIALGKVAGNVSGDLYFDSFIASNGKVVGKDAAGKDITIEKASVSLIENGKSETLIPGDATGADSIDIRDVVSIINEIKKKGNSSGVPDCTKDGTVDIRDVVCVINKIKKRIPLDK